MGTDQYRCIAGNECQIGSGGFSNNQNRDPHYSSPVGSENFPSQNQNFEQHENSTQPQTGGFSEKFMCTEHNKLRSSAMLDQYIQNDGNTAYKCKVGEECKTFGQGGPRRTETHLQRYSPYSSNNRGLPLQPPFKPGVRPSGYYQGNQQYDSSSPQRHQQLHWPTSHRDPYGHAYRPPYNTYPPHFYSFPSSNNNHNSSNNNNHQSADSRPRQKCAIHGKLRTLPNLVETPSGQWECTNGDPCR